MRLQARVLLIKTRLYRFFALAFAFTGLLVFLYLYFKNVEGHLLEALRNPLFVFILLVPFMPAAILAWKAERIEKQFYALLQGSPTDAKKEAPKKEKPKKEAPKKTPPKKETPPKSSDEKESKGR